MIPLKDDNPRIRLPLINVTIIVINILVFIYEVSLGPHINIFIYEYGAIPAYIVQGQNLQTLFTSMFLHGGFLHLGGNMLYLWIFGDNIEGYLGHFQYILFYLICGLLAAVTHILLSGFSEVPMVGASGAISGILGAYLIKYPRARVLVLIPIFWFLEIRKVSALFVLGFWFVIQLFSGITSIGVQGGGVAFWAHVGGFIAGVILINFFPRKPRIEWPY